MAQTILVALLLALLPDPVLPPTPTRASGAYAAALAVDGGRIYVGEPGELSLFPMPSSRAGAVHVYARSAAGDWVREAVVGADAAGLGDRFGGALAARGDLLAVGAPGTDESRGAVHVFRSDDGTWSRVAVLEAPDAAPGDAFGSAVALSGAWLLVGAPGRLDGAGAVLAFRGGEDGWRPAGEIAGPISGGRLGSALEADGDRVAAGAPGPMPAGMPGVAQPALKPGAVLILAPRSDGWAVTATIEAGGEAPGLLGQSVALAGTELFAGAPLAAHSGQVVHFRETEAGWEVVDTLASPIQGQGGFGMSVALAGSDVLVAAPLAGQSGGASALYVFHDDGTGEWSSTELAGPSGAMLLFGLGLAAEGPLAVAGAPGADILEGTGHVYVRGEDGGWREEHVLLEEDAGAAAVAGEAVPCRAGEAEGRSCQGVDLLAFVPIEGLGGGRGIIVNDLWGWTDPETGREYGLVGRSDALVFVDVTDPSSPRVVGELPRTDGAQPSMWRDVKVYDDHAFVVSDNAGPHGMQVFDLRRLRDAAGGEPVTFDPDAVYDGIASAHNIVMDEEAGLAVAVGSSGGGRTCGGGLHMIDVTDPLAPTFAGCFSDPRTGMGTGYSHDAQCVTYRGPDEDYQGREICLGSNANALSIADVTDREDPVAVAAAEYPNSAFLHQGWFSEDQRYYYMNDEIDELAGVTPRTRTLVWDLTDLDDPVLVTEHMGATASSDHNLYVRGDTMYQANYVSGLRVLDISDPEDPREVGFFDTVPGADAPGFAGAWSVYPFFRSGTLLVTSIKEGLFVLRVAPRPVS